MQHPVQPPGASRCRRDFAGVINRQLEHALPLTRTKEKHSLQKEYENKIKTHPEQPRGSDCVSGLRHEHLSLHSLETRIRKHSGVRAAGREGAFLVTFIYRAETAVVLRGDESTLSTAMPSQSCANTGRGGDGGPQYAAAVW